MASNNRPHAERAPEAALERNRSIARLHRWIGIITLQCVFGASVFLLTRAYYLQQAKEALSAADVAAPAAAAPRAVAPPAATGNDPAALRTQAARQFQSQDFEGAVATYQRLVALEPGDPDLLNNLGLVLHYVKRSQQAVARLQEALALNDRHQRSWLTLGFVRKDLGETDAARTAFNRVLEIDGQSSIAAEARRMLEALDAGG